MDISNPTVSIVTVTQYSRRACLAHLSDLIKAQLYKNIVEWVIVEGSNYAETAKLNEKCIQALQNRDKDERQYLSVLPPIIYVPFVPGQHLSDMRNAGNQVCKGDIIVCMDDDDYYPPTRVSHAVYRLTNSAKLLAGCSRAYIYFYLHQKFFQFKSFGKNHSTNNCLAYKREYLLKHRYTPGLDKAEEADFTTDFEEPMEQLDPNKCIVVSGHGYNTVDKSWFCNMSAAAPGNAHMVEELNAASISEYIPQTSIDTLWEVFLKM